MIDKFCPRGQEHVTSVNNSISRDRSGEVFWFCFLVHLCSSLSFLNRMEDAMQHTFLLQKIEVTSSYNVLTTSIYFKPFGVSSTSGSFMSHAFFLLLYEGHIKTHLATFFQAFIFYFATSKVAFRYFGTVLFDSCPRPWFSILNLKNLSWK